MKLIIIPFILLLTTACSNNEYYQALQKQSERNVVIAEGLLTTGGTIYMTCPNGGCELKYTDPSLIKSLTGNHIPVPKNGWDVFERVFNAALTAAVPITAIRELGNVASMIRGNDTTTITNTAESTDNSIKDSFNSTEQTLDYDYNMELGIDIMETSESYNNPVDK